MIAKLQPRLTFTIENDQKFENDEPYQLNMTKKILNLGPTRLPSLSRDPNSLKFANFTINYLLFQYIKVISIYPLHLELRLWVETGV